MIYLYEFIAFFTYNKLTTPIAAQNQTTSLLFCRLAIENVIRRTTDWLTDSELAWTSSLVVV